jgi:CDP-diacylglycerol--serine O-phosphatidyltransferase
MVSTIKYYGFKDAELFKKMKFNMLVIVILFSMVIVAEPSLILFLIILSYVLSGPFTTLWLRKKKRQAQMAPSNGLDVPSQESV